MLRFRLHPAAFDAMLDVALPIPSSDARRPPETRALPDSGPRLDRDAFWSMLRGTLEATAGR